MPPDEKKKKVIKEDEQTLAILVQLIDVHKQNVS